MSDWLFNRRRGADKERMPMQGEFFSTDSIENRADSFVREFIQNSMDAGTGDSVVEVRFHVGEVNDEDQLDELLGDLWPHLLACDPELERVRERVCRYLVAEDFNTSGLRGDPSEVFESASREKNEFFYFFRAEGKSGKQTSSRGSWGIGKYTFPMASAINTFVGVTCRADHLQPGGTGPLMIGQAILGHHVLDGKHYNPDGWWCRTLELDDDVLPIPFGLNGADGFGMERFRSSFRLKRVNQPGLSIMVPFVDEEMNDTTLLTSVLKNFGLAIRLGQLTVTIDDNDKTIRLDSGSMMDALEGLPDGRRQAIRDEIETAQWYMAEGRDERIELTEDSASRNWDGRLTEEHRASIRDALEDGRRITVRVPMPVTVQAKEPEMSWFDVLLQPADGYSGRPHYYREGLRISEVAGSSTHGIKALLLVTDKPLATMLGAAETPAHVDWQAGTERFKGKFREGRNWVSFVKRAPSALIQAVRTGGTEEDLDVASGFFSSPLEDGGRARSAGPVGGLVKPPKAPPPPKPKMFRISSSAAGFRVTPGPELRDGLTATITVSYDVRRGNPFRRWTSDDFLIADHPRSMIGASLVEVGDNWITFEVNDALTFALSVEGFDSRRDLIVMAREAGES